MAIVTASALSVALATGYVWADAADVVPGPLTAAPPPDPLPSPAPEPVVEAPDGAVLDDVAASAVAAVDVAAPPPPDPDVLATVLAPLLGDPALGPDPTLSLRDLASGEEVVLVRSDQAVEPASTAKLVTAAAALQALGAEHQTVTRVGWIPAAERPGGVPALVLVGGGDLLLAAGEGDDGATVGRVGLLDLAREAVAAATEGEQPLLVPGAARVDVLVDDSLLGAPQTLPRGPGDTFFASPPASLAVEAGRRDDGQGRDPAPATTAGTAFVDAVEQALAEAVGPGAPSVGAAQVGADAVPVDVVLAQGRSAPLEDVIAYLLLTSDNTVADAVAGLVAAARDRPPTLASAGEVLVEVVEQDMGVDLGPTALVDGSGLGDGSVATASALTSVLAAAAALPPTDDVSRLPSLLPVAGLDGTVSQRFTAGDDSAGGRGVVRAKTGTLTGTTALAGVLTTASGRGVAFALLSDGVPADGTPAGRAAADRVVAAVADCC